MTIAKSESGRRVKHMNNGQFGQIVTLSIHGPLQEIK